MEPEQKSSSEINSITTISSSFRSIVTTDTTLETPEPTPIRSPTTSEIFYNIILSKIVDKATMTGLDDAVILYDTAYVEVMKAVENVMELTVVEIKEDIAKLLNTAFYKFNIVITERENIVAQRNWERRMRKKLKRTLRKADNFKGYETPPTPSSGVISSHESNKRPPQPPCACHPQSHYNRYPKDRFGKYLAREKKFCDENITLTPVLSTTDLRDKSSETQEQYEIGQTTDQTIKTVSKTLIAKLVSKQGVKVTDAEWNSKTDKPKPRIQNEDTKQKTKDKNAVTPQKAGVNGKHRDLEK